MYQLRTVNEIIDAAMVNLKLRLKEKYKGKEKYQKRMKNRQKLKENRG